MSSETSRLLEKVLTLPREERAVLADELFCSLDEPDADVTALRIQQALDRLAAYDRGELAAVEMEEVFGEDTP
jgi:hypothetical protein